MARRRPGKRDRWAEEDHGPETEFPLFGAGLLLMSIILIVGLLSVLVNRGAVDPSNAEASQPFPSAIVQHHHSIRPMLEDLTRAQEDRDTVRLIDLREGIVRSVEGVPDLPANPSDIEREIRFSYRQSLLDLEDGIEDLLEGLLEDDRVEWEEGVNDIRVAETRLEAVLGRIQRSP